MWEVGQEVPGGRRVSVLDAYAAPPNGICAVFAQRKHLPLRVHLWIDFLNHTCGDARSWNSPPQVSGR